MVLVGGGGGGGGRVLFGIVLIRSGGQSQEGRCRIRLKAREDDAGKCCRSGSGGGEGIWR